MHPVFYFINPIFNRIVRYILSEMKYILHAYDEAFYLFIIYKKFVIRNSAIPDSSKDK